MIFVKLIIYLRRYVFTISFRIILSSMRISISIYSDAWTKTKYRFTWLFFPLKIPSTSRATYISRITVVRLSLIAQFARVKIVISTDDIRDISSFLSLSFMHAYQVQVIVIVIKTISEQTNIREHAVNHYVISRHFSAQSLLYNLRRVCAEQSLITVRETTR